MTRAYIRLDPGFDEHKHAYPDGAYAALVATFCLAESQPQRGRFRDLAYLKALLGKRGRWAKYLVDHQDVVVLKNGKVYVEGWDEWQEGDWKVGERVNRIRRRLHPPTVTATESPAALETVTSTESVGRLDLYSAGGGAGGAKQSPPATDSFESGKEGLRGQAPKDRTPGGRRPQPLMARPDVCQLCGHESHDVKVSLVRWREPVREHDFFDRLARCVDVDACFRRVLDAGEPWPVDDGRVPV